MAPLGCHLVGGPAGGVSGGHALYRVFQATRPDSGAAAGEDPQNWLDCAAEMLHNEWPRGGTVRAYEEKLIHPHDSKGDLYALPCSYLLVCDGDCIGHGRLTECFEGSGGSAVAATYVIISSAARGKAHGSALMGLLEKEAERIGYHYVYLWTQSAVGFYRRLGYMMCEKVSLHRACLQTLEREQVSGLERMLSLRLGRGPPRPAAATASDDGAAASPAAPTDKAKELSEAAAPAAEFSEHKAADDDVWLKKRLVESVGSHLPPLERLLDEMEAEAAVALSRSRAGDAQQVDSAVVSAGDQVVGWRYALLQMPWQRQIGPSCGLAALRMVRDYFELRQDKGEDPGVSQKKMPSLLQVAQEKGYSTDGEVFVAADLQSLAETVCGLRCEMRSFASVTSNDVVAVLLDGGCLIVPYDSHPGTRLPSLNRGRSAHYGVVVGAMLADPEPAQPGQPRLRPIPPDVAMKAEGVADSATLLVVQHSMSQRLCIARLADFAASNAQLEIADDSRFSETRFDLSDRLIVCHGLTS